MSKDVTFFFLNIYLHKNKKIEEDFLLLISKKKSR